MKQKFIEWFTKNNNGCSPAMEDDRSFVHEKTQHMFEAYQAGVAEGEARCAALAAENAALNGFSDKLNEMHNDLNGEGTGIQGRAEVACQQIALEAAMEEFDDIKTPATDRFLAEQRGTGCGNVR